MGTAIMVPAWHVGYGILGPPYAKAHLGGAWACGYIASSLGCGMALGAVVSLIWRPRQAGWTNCLGVAATALPDPLMAGAVIAKHFNRSPRWGRLVKTAGEAGSLEPSPNEAVSTSRAS